MVGKAKDIENRMADVIGDMFSEIFENRPYLSDEALRADLGLYIDEKKQTIEELTERYCEAHDVLVSRNRISGMLNDLAAEDETIVISHEGGKKYVYRSIFGGPAKIRLAPSPGTPIVPDLFEDKAKDPYRKREAEI